MVFTASNVLLLGSFLLVLSIVISKFGSKFGVPTLLLFLIAGMIFGTDGLGVEFENYEVSQFIGMVALVVILFSGGMDTSFKEIKPVLKQGIALSTVGVLLTALITGAFCYFLSNVVGFGREVSFPLSLLLAATMSSTDSASVFNILRSQKIGLKNNLRPMLELESGSNDPMAFMLTIALIQVCMNPGEMVAGQIAIRLVSQIAIGSLLGYGMGRITVWFINHINLKNVSLYPIILICIALFTFSMTDNLNGNGYLAVYLAGLVIGNKPLVKKRDCLKSLDGMTWLLQIIMFVNLGLLVNPHEMLNLKISALGVMVGMFVIFIGRPIAVFLTLIPFKQTDFKSKVFLSWVGLRGATPILFAIYPAVAGVPYAKEMFNTVFFITILSLILQGTTVPFMARKLNLDCEEEASGNSFGIELPEEIDSKLWDMTVTPDILENGNQLKNMNIPEGQLVIMVKRGDKYLVPNGSLKIKPDDKLLMIASQNQDADYEIQA